MQGFEKKKETIFRAKGTDQKNGKIEQ